MARFEHFAIYAADTTALRDFYTESFGLRTIFTGSSSPPAYFLADEAGMAIEIIHRPADEPTVNQRWVCHLALWVDDYATVHAALAKRGVAFETDTAVDNDALKTAFFKDPEGNRCQIVWRNPPLGR